MKRKMVKLLLVLGVAVCSATMYAGTSINTMINGKVMRTVALSVKENNMVLVPIKEVCDQMGLDYKYDTVCKKLVISGKGKKLVFQINKTAYTENDVPKQLEVKVMMVNNKAYIHAKAIGEIFDVPVLWDDINNAILINTKDKDLTELKEPMTLNQGHALVAQLYDARTNVSAGTELTDKERVYDEKGSNFYAYTVSNGEKVYVNKYTGEMFAASKWGEYRTINVPRIPLKSKIQNMAVKELGGNVKLVKMVKKEGRAYYCFVLTADPSKGIIIGDNAIKYSASVYTKKGILQKQY